MRKSILSGLSCCAGVICVAALLGACRSSATTGDGRAGDVKRADVGRADLDASGCGPSAICKEQCLDARATQPPLFAWTSTWGQSSNAAFMAHITSEARRCHWSNLGGNCTMYDCLASDWTGAAATMTGTSAGKITIGNGSGKDEVFLPDTNGVYDVTFWNTARWKEGDQITFTAEGAAIPAFALTIGFPKLVEAGNPLAQDAGTKPQIDRGAAMTFSWTPTDEKVIVMLAQLPSFTATPWDRQELWCIFDGTAGTGTVPADVLQHLRTDLPATGYGIAHYNRSCYNVGGFHVQATGTHGTWWEATVK